MFVKTQVETLKEEASLACKHPKASLVLLTLKMLVGTGKNYYGGILISYSNLMLVCDIKSKTTMSTAIKKLVDGGFIGIAKIGRNSVYLLHHDYLSMTKHSSPTHTSLDGIKVFLDDEEALEIKRMYEFIELKHIRESSELASLKLKGKRIQA